jgi:hypothetical protein
LIAFGHVFIYLLKADLPWEALKPLPKVELDDKDPLIYKKTMEQEQALKKWQADYL